jgi:hypothetical protein
MDNPMSCRTSQINGGGSLTPALSVDEFVRSAMFRLPGVGEIPCPSLNLGRRRENHNKIRRVSPPNKARTEALEFTPLFQFGRPLAFEPAPKLAAVFTKQ